MILEEKKLLLNSLQQTQRGRTGCHEQASLQAYVFSHVRLFATPCSLSGSSVHGIFQARVMEQVVITYSKGSSQLRDRTHVYWISCFGRWVLYHCTTWEAFLTPTMLLQKEKETWKQEWSYHTRVLIYLWALSFGLWGGHSVTWSASLSHLLPCLYPREATFQPHMLILGLWTFFSAYKSWTQLTD